MSAALDVVIVSYRCESLLRDCLVSLRDFPPERPIRVHVVDNASHDGTAEMVSREFPQVEVTASQENLGFSVANNLAIRAGDGPHVLVLNPDTRITEGALEALSRLLDERPELGMVWAAGSSRRTAASTTPPNAASRPRSAPSATSRASDDGSENGRLSQYRATELDEFEAGPVEAINGAFMLIRRSALERVGLFDEGYWMYMEDLDLCYRFAEAGLVTWYEPSVTVIHAKAGSSGKNRRLRLNYAFHYGMFRFYRAHYAPERNPLVNGAIYAGIALKFAASAVRSAFNRGVARLRGGG